MKYPTKTRPLPYSNKSIDLFHPAICKEFEITIPENEYKFDPNRKWKMDYAWPIVKLFVEIEGGVWTKGRHTRGSGFIKDMEKYNRAAEMGWRLLRYQPPQGKRVVLKPKEYYQIKSALWFSLLAENSNTKAAEIANTERQGGNESETPKP